MILVIETATTACSVALIDGDKVVAHRHEDVARGHAERLIPMIGELPGGGKADQILVNCGPGSFTGVRVGLAAAKALGLAWGIPVKGYSTHALLAAALFERQLDISAACIAIEGGHGEVFVQSFARAPLSAIDLLRSLPPSQVEALEVAAGSAAPRLQAQRIFSVEPDARFAALLPPELRSAPAQAIYGRAPDAKPNP